MFFFPGLLETERFFLGQARLFLFELLARLLQVGLPRFHLLTCFLQASGLLSLPLLLLDGRLLDRMVLFLGQTLLLLCEAFALSFHAGLLRFQLPSLLFQLRRGLSLSLLFCLQCLLREQGFRVAMDDFGTGYSSLGYLHRLPFDTIKIDRSFLLAVDADDRSRQLLAGIVSLCRALDMQIVAEGVETQAQFELLKDLGVDTFQGFLLGRPQSLECLLDAIRAADR